MWLGYWGGARASLGQGISWRLPEEVDPGSIFPLWAVGANIVRRNLGPMDAPVCGPHQCDGDLTLDVSVLPRLGLTQLCCEATGYPFHGSHCLHIQNPINGGNEGRKLLALLEACIQVYLFFARSAS